MAGLLDFLTTPESQLGIGLLAAASSGRSFGEGLLGATQSVAAQRRGLLQDKLLQSQVDENTSQAEMRKQQLAMAKRQMEIDNSLLGYGARPDAGYVAPATGGGASPALMGAPSSGGTAAPTVSTPGGPMTLTQLSSAYGIPYEALAFDLVKNGGKGISDMIYKRGTPDIQVSNGYAYDKNRLGAGFLPSLSTAQDGKTSMVRIGADGLPAVSAPQGALETYGGYQRINNMLGAAYTPGRPVLDAEGRQRGQSQLSEIGGGAPPMGSARPSMPSGYAGGSRESADSDRLRILQEELRKPNLPQADREAIQRDIARISPNSASSPAGALDFSPAEKAAQDAARARATDTAKADVVRDSDNRSKVRNATENLTNADRAIELLRLGPTGSAIGSMVDKGAAVFGRSTPGGNIAAQLDIVSANMVKNVPRFEGPQSNIDVEGYKAAAGRVADRSLPIDQRIAAAQEVKYFEQKAIRQAAGQQSGGASGSWEPNSNQTAPQPRATMRFNPATGRLEKVN